MGFWSDLFGEPKCDKMPSQKYSNTPEDDQDGANAERIKPKPLSDAEIRERFETIHTLLRSDLSKAAWPGFKIDSDRSLSKVTITHESSDETLSAYRDGDISGTKSRRFQQLGMTTLAGFVFKLESLIENDTIKIERTLKGHIVDLNLPNNTLFVSSCNKIAYHYLNPSYMVMHKVEKDVDLDLNYVTHQEFDVPENKYSWVTRGETTWLEQLTCARQIADRDKFKVVEVDIREHWLDEYAEDQLRSRILRERDLKEWIQEIVTLHARYNENARKYEFAEAGPLDSPEAIQIFLHLVNRSNAGFSEMEIINFLQFKGMLKSNYNTGKDTRCPNRQAPLSLLGSRRYSHLI